MELLPLLPNRLGVGVEDDEDVELVGLLAIKENAGFGAAAAESDGKRKHVAHGV